MMRFAVAAGRYMHHDKVRIGLHQLEVFLLATEPQITSPTTTSTSGKAE